jgi:hypothetical protein
MSWAGMWTPTFRPAGNLNSEKRGKHFALKCWQQPTTLQDT